MVYIVDKIFIHKSCFSVNTARTENKTCDSSGKKRRKPLDCGRAVNMTKYDHLRGIADRANHPHIPEPEVAMIFKKKSSRSNEVDMTDLEKKLRKAKKEVENKFHKFISNISL